VYATCSLEPEENDEVTKAFLAAHPDFALDPPPEFPIPLDMDGTLRCLPHRHGTDGFTAVRFRRSSNGGTTASLRESADSLHHRSIATSTASSTTVPRSENRIGSPTRTASRIFGDDAGKPVVLA